MNKVMDYYSTFDEWGRLDREPLEFQINWHYIQKDPPKNGSVLDNGAIGQTRDKPKLID
ncbi:hypothetical protein ABEP42_02605 [Priestia megaterium]